MTTNNRPFHVRIDNEWMEEIYRSAASRKEGEQRIASFEERFALTFDAMLTEYQAAPATGDWLEYEDGHYHVAARTVLSPGASKSMEVWLLVERAPSDK